MRGLVACIVFLVPFAQAEVSSDLVQGALRADWSSFKAKHKKAYSADEENSRLANYLDNTRVIEEHNARYHQGLESYELGLNELSDFTLEEVRRTRMGLVVPPNAAEIAANASRFVAPPEVIVPSEIDWRSKKCVQGVKHQGSCGSCYAFSTIGAVETAYCVRRRGKLRNLSEQHIVDCAGRGCRGGWMPDMFNFLKKNRGAINTSNYPYNAKEQACQQRGKRRSVRVRNYVQIRAGDENELMRAVATVGGLAVAYNAATQEHSHYRSGILDIPNCKSDAHHAALLIGYGSENGKEFWILKNSWGEDWGEDWGEKGYFRLARGKNMCGIADWASYPIAA